MVNDFFKIRIPFVTKGWISDRKKDKLKIKGCVFFIFDRKLGMYVDDYIHLEEANYRMTDEAMIKTKGYYGRNKYVRDFRKNFLDKYSNNTHPNKIKNFTHKELNKSEINEVNEYFKKIEKTHKQMFSLLSGSNISGANQNPKASPLVCNDGDYFGCNFSNALKQYESKSKVKREWNDIKEYGLKDVLSNEIIPNFKEVFMQYNKFLDFRENIPEAIVTDDISQYFDDKNISEVLETIDGFLITERQNDFINLYLNGKLDNQVEFNSNKSKLITKLRSFYTSNIQKGIKSGNISLHHTTIKNNLAQIENAHILQFSKLVNNGTYDSLRMSIDPFNCLRIDSSIHVLWDKNEIGFNSSGDIVMNNAIIKKEYLDMNEIKKNKGTKKYFDIYLSEN